MDKLRSIEESEHVARMTANEKIAKFYYKTSRGMTI